MRERLHGLPGVALEPPAGPRAEVDVGVVDGRVHLALAVDDRRGLQVVGRDTLALHAEHSLGDVGEAAPVERQGNVGRRDPLREHAVGGLDVGRAVAVREIGAVVAVGRRLDLLVCDLRERERVEDGLDRPRAALAHAADLVFRDRLEAGVDLPVALDRQPLVQVVGVVVAAAEHVVVARHHRVARGDEVGPGQELSHQLGGLAELGVRGDGVVAGGDLEVEPGGEDVLGEDLARSRRDGERERDARDGAVLHPLRAGGADGGEAARLEVEHGAALRVAHERLRAAAGGEAHLDAARGVGGGEQRLRPGRVVAVHEDRLGAVDGERLRVRHEPLDGELEVPPLLHGALGHDAGSAGLRADEDRERVQRRVARHTDRRLDLGEAAQGRLGGVGGEQGRVLLQVRHVGLVGGAAARAQLLQREHQLDRVEQRDDAREARRCEPAGEPDQLLARHVDVHEPPRELAVVERHRLLRHVEVEAIADDEVVDDVEVRGGPAVHGDDPALVQLEPRLGVVRPVHRHQPQLRVGGDQQLLAERLLLPREEAFRPLGLVHRSARAGRAPRRPRGPRARRPPSAARRTRPRAARPSARAPARRSGAA